MSATGSAGIPAGIGLRTRSGSRECHGDGFPFNVVAISQLQRLPEKFEPMRGSGRDTTGRACS